MKKLNISYDPKNSISLRENVFLDLKCDVYSREHQGFYIVTNGGRQKSSRIYFSLEKQTEYYKKLDKYNPESSVFKASFYHLYDNFPKHKHFIKEYFNTILVKPPKHHTARHLIDGVRMLLSYAKKLGIKINNVSDINSELQLAIHEFIQNSPERPRAGQTRGLTAVFGYLEKNKKDFAALPLDYGSQQSQPIEALPLTTLFKLDIVARKELNHLMDRHTLYKQWKDEFKTINLFSLENLARSYYDDIKQRGSDAASTIKIYNRIAKKLYDTDLRQWSGRNSKERGGEYYYSSEQKRQKHKELIEISKHGRNIMITNEKMFCFWHMELIPNFPFEYKIDPKYSGILTERGLTAMYRNKIGRSIEQFHNMITPDIHAAYALALFLLIREGKNSEVLQSWKIKKGNDSNYHLGTDSSFGLIVEGTKSRVNKKQKSVFHNSSDEKKFIDFYLDYAEPIYKKTKNNAFFQYSIKQGKSSIGNWGRNFFPNVKASSSPNSLFHKYKIHDSNNSRIYSIMHRRIRPAVNYSNYLKGLSEYERMSKLGHQDKSTQKQHYENSAEWKGRKRYMIAKTQEMVVNFFRGKIERSDTRSRKLYEGIFADCADPFNPDYPGAPKIRSGEGCSSWFKCFGCSKSLSIPEIHGEVMYAYIHEMEERKKQFYRTEDWDKEYLYDYLMVKSAFDNLTDEEKDFAQKNAYKHIDIVKMNFRSKVKIKEIDHEKRTVN